MIKINKDKFEELDNLIIQGLKLFDDDTFTKVSGSNITRLEEIDFVLLINLDRLTNIKSEFFNLKASYEFGRNSLFGTLAYHLLARLGRSKLKKNFENLVKILDDYVNEIRSKPLKKYTFYLPTRIELSLNKMEEFKLKSLVKKTFGIQLIRRLPDAIIDKFKETNFEKLFSNRSIILRVDFEARDYQFALDNKINIEIDSFIGLIAFANNDGRISKRWSLVDFDKSIAELPLEPPNLFIISEGNTIIYPDINKQDSLINIDIQIQHGHLITRMGKELWRIHNDSFVNYQFILVILNVLIKQSKSINCFSKECLKLYTESIIEKQLEVSFLKFWIISEKILKCAGPINDEKILNFLKKVIIRKGLKETIESIYKKRNDLVHEFKIDTITERDRNLSKIFADRILEIYFDPNAKFNTFEEFRFILENNFLDKGSLIPRFNILKKLIKMKSAHSKK